MNRTMTRTIIILQVLNSLLLLCVGSKIVTELVSFYSTVLKNVGKESLDSDGITTLMNLFDGNPKYNHAAVEYIMSQVLKEDDISFDRLYQLIDAIYGDQISDDPYQPQEVHIALGSDSYTMKAMWVTMESLEEPIVQFMRYEEIDWTASTSIPAVNYTYEVPQKWWAVFSGMIYEADMTGLVPEQRYKYRVSGYDKANDTNRYSDEFTFTAAPLPTNPNRDTRIASLADHGTFELLGFATVDNMVALKEELGFEMVFVAGDLSYAGLSTDMPRLNISKEDEFELIWDLLGIQNQPIAANYPWMVGNGNHERFYNWSAYTNRYKMPQNHDLGSGGNFWYSFDYGNIHWLSASSEHPLDIDSDQMQFLIKDLEAAVANRASVPWIVFSLHKPLYCSADGTPGGYADQLEDLLLKYDVDLTIVGHMHAYERVHPVKQGEVTLWPQKESVDVPPLPSGIGGSAAEVMDVYYSDGVGPVQVVQGHAGGMQAERWNQPQPAWSAIRMANGYVPPNSTSLLHSEVDFSDDTIVTPSDIPDVPLLPPNLEERSVYYTDTYGFGLIRAINSTHLYYRNVPDTAKTVGKDQFYIIRNH